MKEMYGKLEHNGKEYIMAFNLNVMEDIQEEYGTLDKWSELTSGEEPNAKAIKYGFAAMLNEGIDIMNEEKGTEDKPLTLKQVGRLLSEIGLEKAAEVLQETVVESTQSTEKNA